MKKRLFALLLTAALLFTLLPQTVLFASADDSGTCGTNLQWSIDEATGTLTITGSGAMTDWNYYSKAPWYSYCSSIRSVSLPDGLTSIGHDAFSGCTGLTAISIPDSVTSIGNYAFYDCAGLTEVHISDIAAWCGISFGGYYANPLLYAKKLYLNDTLITDLVIPSGVTSIGDWVFYNCTGLTSITIPDSVTSIGSWAFEDCTGLTSITIPDSVTSIGSYAFRGCTGLSLIIFRGSKPSVGSECFAGITAVAGYPIDSSWDSTVTSPSFAAGTFTFFLIKNNQLTGAMTDFLEFRIDLNTFILTVSGPDDMPAAAPFPWSGLADFVTGINIVSGVRTISASAFAGLPKVEEVTVPESVSQIGNNAFFGCSALTTVTVLNKDCRIAGADETLGVPGVTVIRGHKGSTAEAWAAAHGYEFVPLPDCENGNHDYVSASTAATCTEQGYTTHTCSACGETFVDSYVPALGHNFIGGVCTRCGEDDPNHNPIMPGDPCEGYTDINRNGWYHSAADFVIANGYMGSTSTTALTFEPNAKVTRAMVASILYRICGSPAVEYSGKFTDVKEGSWYTNAIEWCAQNGLASGYTDGSFKPNATVSRQELAVFMCKLAEHLGRDVSGRADLSGFADASSVPNWSKDYLAWAVDAGIISGQANGGKNYLKPADGAKRCEFASILMRFV